jgi:hypothetical protein
LEGHDEKDLCERSFKCPIGGGTVVLMLERDSDAGVILDSGS